jgi:hypothetical protein
VAVAAGRNHSLGLRADGSIAAWGQNTFNVPEPNTGFVAVAADGTHSLVLRANHRIAAWGLRQCNVVPEPNRRFVAVAAGDAHCLGLRGDGSIAAWGGNDYGQCDVPGPNTGFVAAAAGGAHSLGIWADGVPMIHSADLDGDGVINISDMLRIFQLFSLRGYHCVTTPGTSDDGYLAGSGDEHACRPHASDFSPQDWRIDVTELLRLIQFYNMHGYRACPGMGTEDGYCPGPA